MPKLKGAKEMSEDEKVIKEELSVFELKQQTSDGAWADTEADWDLNALRLEQNFEEIVGAQPVIAAVAVRKPRAQEWFRVHPAENWRLPTTILQLKEERDSYLIHPKLRPQLWEEIQPIRLYTAISRQNEVFIWPIRLSKGDGKIDRFIETDLAAVKAAERSWTRRYWIAEANMHKILIAKNLSEEPLWPTDVDFREIIKIAFKDRFIDDLAHPVLKRLRGEL
jgi:hypothetical protein